MRKVRARTVRRAQDRAVEKHARAADRVFLASEGGTPARPLVVTAGSQVEAKALSVRCPRCQGRHQITEHRAGVEGGHRVRALTLSCLSCRSARVLYVAVAEVH